MAGHYWVRPDELRGRATGYSGVADRLEVAHTELRAALAAAGACWGDDEAGQRFARRYRGPAATTQQAFVEFAEGMGDIHVKLVAMADNYEQTDQSEAERFGSGDVR